MSFQGRSCHLGWLTAEKPNPTKANNTKPRLSTITMHARRATPCPASPCSSIDKRASLSVWTLASGVDPPPIKIYPGESIFSPPQSFSWTAKNYTKNAPHIAILRSKIKKKFGEGAVDPPPRLLRCLDRPQKYIFGLTPLTLASHSLHSSNRST